MSKTLSTVRNKLNEIIGEKKYSGTTSSAPSEDYTTAVDSSLANYELIEQAILTRLSQIDLLGGRIYPVKAPQDVELPYLIFFKVATSRDHSHSGSSHLASAWVQFSSFAQTYEEGKQIVGEIKTLLDSFRGTITNISINGCFLQEEVDFLEEDTGLYHIACDYRIVYNE